MMKTDKTGIYIHIPFCLKKCNYCDFCSFAGLDNVVRQRYVDALINEIFSYKREKKISVDTVFFGGGTPSLLEKNQFKSIMSAIRDTFEVDPDAEITLEANPKTLNEDNLSSFINSGVNRLSIGMQTIHENERLILGRIHNYSDFSESLRLARRLGIKNINVDIMYGIPEQTLSSFVETVKTVVSLGVEHISAYSLIIEEGTPFYEDKNLILPSEDDEISMYDFLTSFLRQNGYSRYEISNYAKDGYTSRHNLKYWKLQDYIGVGLSASSFFEGVRYTNTADMNDYVADFREHRRDIEQIDLAELAREYIMLGLRLKEGISLSEYKRLFGKDFYLKNKDLINGYIKNGFMCKNNDRIYFTDKGFYISLAVLSELI